MPDTGVVGNAVKLVGEAAFPGVSGLLDGDVKAGVGHALLGFATGALLGPTGVLLVKANSFAYSVSGRHLHQHIGESFSGLFGNRIRRS